MSEGVPEGGSIEIRFPATYFGRVYPNCRSVVTNGSALESSVGEQLGEVSCRVQAGINWYIRNFKGVEAGPARI